MTFDHDKIVLEFEIEYDNWQLIMIKSNWKSKLNMIEDVGLW